MRKITVVSSDTQTKVTFETEATTVAQLREEFDNRGICYEGKELFEGISHTVINPEVLDTILPHDNQYRGVVTNDLVIMITSGKKIKNGMDRAEAYSYIKAHNLATQIQAEYGKNFTNLPTATLVEFVLNAQEGTPDQEPESFEEAATSEEAPMCAGTTPDQENCSLEEFLGQVLENALKKGLISPNTVVNSLKNAGYVVEETATDYEAKEEVKSNFSDDDIADMFAGFDR